MNLKISQIARHVGVSRNTVYKYIDMTPEEFQQSSWRGEKETRKEERRAVRARRERETEMLSCKKVIYS
ncbi:MAG: helix-turn-helix domain-containing protein [Clostridiales bacterium]|nr:helix-turn-helix domain-containing protein [Clostridiales bacterium]MCF8022470.1 helix-turn-helix domain-containing protein [Clostridiales bacterium]